MYLNQKTLERLRELINEETEYRKGPQLVKLFNSLGSRDSYGQGFPSRWQYTDQKLAKINGTPELDKLFKILFNPINYIGKFDQLDSFIADINQYMAFDKWKVVRNNTEITFQRVNEIKIPDTQKKEIIQEDAFLDKEFEEVELDKLGLHTSVTTVVKARFDEIKNCFNSNAPLAVIFLSGSSLEGVLLGIAIANPKEYNSAKTAPKKDDKVKQFHEWTLMNLIDTSYELGLLKEDVKKFSHVLRDFRNYIHPLQQVGSNFHPDKHTAKLCWQVLKAAIYQLVNNRINR
ncbi:hypothetical protein GCM10017764_09740 [Sphingobacterium griseoflavum]|uniref:Abortive infection protein-like C-terminal domain-containing protein n=2 Tax=Sphingobacterium griseoflavum TaxID=1474952 RepID=A0ABQ3HS33_9SPHI|nr:hypothetical protein GCM10017764_09740 [Sphingobacterium griseoflavum]